MTKIFLKKKHFQELVNLENDGKLSIELKDLDFSVRAMNSLSNQGLKTLGELVVYSENDLRSFPKMGRTSIEEIKNILENYSLYLGMHLNQFNSEDNKKADHQQNKEWKEVSRTLLLELIKDFNEIPLSLRAKNALLNLGCNYVGDIISINKSELFRIKALGYKSILEIEDYLKNFNLNFGDQLDPWNKDIVIKLREELREEVLETKKFELIDQDKLLEVELKRVLNEAIQISTKHKSKKDRVIDILNSRFGLDGSPAKTLEIIGQKYNVTRERIRQNESYGLRKLRFSKPITPILDKIFEILNQSLPITEIEFNRILKERGLTEFEWDFKGLKDFYESFTAKQDFYVSIMNNLKIISKASVENIFRLVLVNTNKMISNSGLFSLTECMGIKDIYLNNIKKETVKKIIQIKPMFNWLDEQQNYFTYYSKRNRLSNLISKVSNVSKSIEVDLLLQKIKNYPRINNDVNYSLEILISFCKVSFDCKLEDPKTIKFNNSESKISDYDGYKGNFISPNEQKIVQIFREYGPILEYDDLKDLAEKNGVKKDSLSMILQFSPLFYRIDVGFYKLTEKTKEKILDKIISIINLESLTFAKDECPIIKGKKTFIEVNKNGHLFKSLPYERPMRFLPDGSNGVVYKRKVYPIINSLKENKDKREKVDLD